MATGLGLSAYRYRDVDEKSDVQDQVTQAHINNSFSFELDSTQLLYKTWSMWGCSWLFLWLSADHGTPFSHLLSLVSAWGLAALFLTVFYAVTRKSISELKLTFESHELSLRQIFKTQISQVCLLLTLIFGLASQNVSQTLTHAFPDLNENSLATDSLLSEAKLEQAWVYTLDPLSKKRARIGRWSDLKDAHFINPYSKVTEKHLSGDGIEQTQPTAILDKDKKSKMPAKSRLRLRITGGDFKVTREQACSGSSVYHYVQPIGGTVDLSVFKPETQILFSRIQYLKLIQVVSIIMMKWKALMKVELFRALSSK